MSARYKRRRRSLCTPFEASRKVCKFQCPLTRPRVYEGTARGLSWDALFLGLSPRVRGNPFLSIVGPVESRFIPACTGEPFTSRGGSSGKWVYPRVYGGTASGRSRMTRHHGLSPRVRGNLQVEVVRLNKRSLSPRVRGNPHFTPPRLGPFSLSPRVRGNRRAQKGGENNPESIPACTGEPLLRVSFYRSMRVYPRVYGGTSMAFRSVSREPGLSPRVRGNRIRLRLDRRYGGSIPACTGEPSWPGNPSRRSGVYPRVYGGTPGGEPRLHHVRGLSPRVRGNHSRRVERFFPRGSIPACTGEPRR